MKTLQKKITCCLLAILCCMGIFLNTPAPVHAKASIIYETSAARIAAAGTPVRESFTMAQSSAATLVLDTLTPVGFTITVYDADDSVFATNHFSEDDPLWKELSGDYYYPCGTNLPKGNYTAELTFDDDAIFLFYVIADSDAQAILSHQKLTLTAGFSKTLTVTGNSGKVTWKSSNASIASVNSSGKITAKKKGTCSITATVDNRTLKCSVTVKANTYSFQKMTNSQIQDDIACMVAYKASFDSSGNLKIKMQILNNSGNHIRYLKDIKIVFKNAENKTVFSHKISRQNVSVVNQDKKDFTVTIKKSALKGKKIDLRNVMINATGKYGYLK